MKINIVAILILVTTYMILQSFTPQKTFNRKQFYSTIRQDDLEKINVELQSLETASFEGMKAFQGALMMKKAGVIKGPSAKLKLFKKGGKQLEAAIKEKPQNAEYRFLRLIIQEHAPKIVNYRDDIAADKEMIVTAYKSFSPELQKVVSEYSTSSKALDPKDF